MFILIKYFIPHQKKFNTFSCTVFSDFCLKKNNVCKNIMNSKYLKYNVYITYVTTYCQIPPIAKTGLKVLV